MRETSNQPDMAGRTWCVFFLLYREKITFQYIDPKSILPLSRIDCRLEIGFERLHSLRLPCTWTPLLSIFTESLMNPCRSYNDRSKGTEGVLHRGFVGRLKLIYRSGFAKRPYHPVATDRGQPLLQIQFVKIIFKNSRIQVKQ